MKDKVLWAILTHQKASCVERMVAYWSRVVGENIVIVYGGSREEFDRVNWAEKLLVESEWLFTNDHQRERQSYCGVFDCIHTFLKKDDSTHVFFTEYDQLPLREDVEILLLNQLRRTNSDVLFQDLKRVDGSNHAHWLYEKSLGNLEQALHSVSLRKAHCKEKVILSALGFGQFWKVDAFMDLAGLKEPPRVYLELWIPTLVYHLGYNVGRSIGSNKLNRPMGEIIESVEDLKYSGEPFVHPVKSCWDSTQHPYLNLLV